MNMRAQYSLTAACGLLGTAALVAYYAAPYTFMPLPPANASAAQVSAFGTSYSSVILLDAWLQVVGSALSVIFVVALVHLAGASQRLAGKLTALVGGVILTLSMMEAMLAIGAVQSGALGHLQTALVCFDLIYTFIHVFLIAPSIYLVLGAALLGTRLLPQPYCYAALALGVVFQVLGAVGLFDSSVLLIVIVVLMAQELWAVVAAILLVLPTAPDRGRAEAPPASALAQAR